jgi:hypothetical protein
MRHIKFFLEGFDKSDYYQEMDRGELLYLRSIGFTSDDDELLKLIQFLNSRYIKFDLSPTNSVNFYSEDGRPVYILTVVDEYYYVAIGSRSTTPATYWKCDQFEGLMELLKDKGVI